MLLSVRIKSNNSLIQQINDCDSLKQTLLRRISLLILSLTFASTSLMGQGYYFKNFKVENGLSHNTVLCALQDSRGFMWLGTKDGLNRFDGYSFKYYQKVPDEPKSLGSNFIECLYEYESNLWVGTDSGLFLYNEQSENFELLEASMNRPILDIEQDDDGNLWYIAGAILHKHSLKSKETIIYDAQTFFNAEEITKSLDGNIWVANDNYLYKYNHRTNSFTNIQIVIDDQEGLPVVISKISPLDDQSILIGTQNHGALIFDINTQKTRKLLKPKEDPLYVRDFARKNSQEIWMATESGIYIYNILTGNYTNLKKNYNDPYALSDNAIYSLTVDNEGGIWMGTYFGGINYYPNQYTRFNKYYPRSGSNAISGNAVREIHPDHYGNLWIGTEDAGLNKFDPETQIFTNFRPSEEPHTLSHYNIHALLPRGDHLWIGTFEHGLDIMDINSGRIIKHYRKGDGKGLSSNFIYALYEDDEHVIYAVTTSGIQVYNEEEDRFTTHPAFSEDYFFTYFLKDPSGVLWAGSYWDGLFYFDPSTNKKGLYRHDDSNPNSLSSNAINSIFIDSQKEMWVTTEYGLNRYRKSTGDFKTYSTRDGFPSNVFYSIIEEDKERFWISTSNGLVAFNPITEEIKVYTRANGLLSDQFNYSSAYKDPKGNMYFGSVSGLISFNPDSFTQNTYKPPIYITGLQINNKEVLIDKEGSPLEKSVTFTDEITLKPNVSAFSIDFAALSYTAPQMTEYWYKLDGLNEDWLYLQQNHKVYFTGLAAKDYSLSIKSLNSSGIWSEENSVLKIKVLPTFWKSNAAYALYIFLTGVLIFVILRHYHARTSLRNKQMLRELSIKKEKEVFQAKIEFFTNVSHEIRTPLTLIKGPLEKMLKRVNDEDPELKMNLSIMEKNTSRLLDLTNQLLDFRKTELQDISLTFVETDIANMVRDTYSRFCQAIEDKNLQFDINFSQEEIYAYIDREAFRKIFSNLLNNAIKYAENKISISLDEKNEFFELRIKNDGDLIPAHLKNKIFEPFYRISGAENQSQPGTGIGLSLAYSLVELHHGTISLDTSDAQMNTFVLKFPIHQEKEFRLFEPRNSVLKSSILPAANLEPDEQLKSNLLLVEDNVDLLDFVAKDLAQQYLVFKAISAENALEYLSNENISLIISDVMLPGMDGFTFCEKVKTELETSHIPLIMLTSKNALNARIQGLESGADAYIEKPFAMEHLKVQIANLLENRKHIMEHYSSSPLAHIRSIAHTKIDETFIKKLEEVIFKNIADPDLNVETLAEIMHMSRSTLYRKIKDLSNLSPNELVNITRLKKAAELLKLGDYKIYEIAEMVGYNSQTSFGRNFLKQFGMTPTEYMKT